MAELRECMRYFVIVLFVLMAQLSRSESQFSLDTLPPVDIWGKDLFCSSDLPDTLMASHLGGIWTGPGIFNPNIGVFDPAFAREGTHTVYYSIQMGNCEVRDSMIIKVYEQPFVDLGNDTVLCDDQVLTLNVPTNALNIFWEDGSREATRTITMSGSYSVELSNVACRVTDTITVLYDESPQFDLGENIDTCAVSLTLAVPDVDIWSYEWQDGSTADTFLIEANGTYSLKATSVCGEYEDAIDVYLDGCDCRVFVPNSFSPDGDGLNDIFKPFFQGDCQPGFVQFRVFNRWGAMIYQGMNNDIGWNGMFRNERLPPDVFIYDLSYRIPSGKMVHLSGDVTIIR